MATEAEAKERLAADAKLVPSPEVFEVAKQLQGDYTEGSDLEGMIKADLDIRLPKKWINLPMATRREFIQTHTPGKSEDNPCDKDEFPPYENKPVGEVQLTVVFAVEIAYELFKIDNPCEKRLPLRQINDILALLDGWKRTTWKCCGVYGQTLKPSSQNILKQGSITTVCRTPPSRPCSKVMRKF